MKNTNVVSAPCISVGLQQEPLSGGVFPHLRAGWRAQPPPGDGARQGGTGGLCLGGGPPARPVLPKAGAPLKQGQWRPPYLQAGDSGSLPAVPRGNAPGEGTCDPAARAGRGRLFSGLMRSIDLGVIKRLALRNSSPQR